MTTPINLNAYFSRTDIHVEGDVMCMKPQDLPFEELGKARSLIWCADFASSGDRAARGFTADQMTCFECKREPVAVEFSDYDRGGYPRNAWRLCARLVCGEHGQEMAYWAHLGGSLRGGMSWAEDWGSHLAEKVWFHPDFEDELRAAERITQEYQARARASHDFMRRRIAKTGKEFVPPQNPRNISISLRTYIMERDNFRCRRCGNEPKHVRLVIDHIKPVSKGGTAAADNLQTLCEPCNAAKADRDPHAHDLTAGRE